MSDLTRRRFLKLSALLGISSTVSIKPIRVLAEDLEKIHLPQITMPTQTKNGGVVPINIQIDHPMEPDHYIKSVEIFNRRDPIISKGKFHLTPDNGSAYLSTQVRMHSGTSQVEVIVECNQHGKWVHQKPITIEEGGGGCATETGNEDESFEIRPPTVRIPHLIEEGSIAAGEIVKVQVKFKHPNRTGLKFVEGQFIPAKPPFYVRTMEVLYDGNRVSFYEMTEALSDNPFIGFMLKISKEAPLQIVFVNNQDQRFEVIENLKVV